MKNIRNGLLVVTIIGGALFAVQSAHAALTGTPQQVAAGLSTPWEILPTPDGDIFITELPGRVRIVRNGSLLATPALTAPANTRKFLGLALDPAYSSNNFVYLYHGYHNGNSGCSTDPNTTPCKNRVVRYVDSGNALTGGTVILDNIPSEGNHDGGRIKFGPDGKLYITTGDIHNPTLPRNLNSLNGKILRINSDGTIPSDNPFYNQAGKRGEIWSYGHRHPQGIAWNASGVMYETEHGPSGEPYAGGQRGQDEVNRIVKGGDYGWPESHGDTVQSETIAPVIHSGPSISTTWAPSGAAFGPDGLFYVPTLAAAGQGGRRIRAFELSGSTVVNQIEYYNDTYGRLRTTTVNGNDLYFGTSNGTTNEKVYRVQITGAQPVYRFWSPRFSNAHFYTVSTAEKNRLISQDNYANGGNWVYEGVGYNALTGSCSGKTTVHRFWSPVFLSHFYSGNEAEKNRLIAEDAYSRGGNWTYEGAVFCAEATDTAETSPLHRFWSPNFRKHFYTADNAEKTHLQNNDPNWTYEGAVFYVY